ncbi:hypothetical protein HPB49_021139 [Dermacentor silvarum]|uniref:Uncharacterized protein n=1 Tax=Dermacentor silvarum TaxID=543639 RepID=A0ACB8CT77_DERSI|nr:hypothetical protein HPB49_021139 [Dermacentor silvarum]
MALSSSGSVQWLCRQEYTIYSDSQAAIHHIQNRTLPYSLQKEVERVVSALPPSTVFLRWVPGRSGIDGNELAHKLARDVSNRAPLIPWPKPSEDGGRLTLRRTIKEVYLKLRLDKRLYPPPDPSLNLSQLPLYICGPISLPFLLPRCSEIAFISSSFLFHHRLARLAWR